MKEAYCSNEVYRLLLNKGFNGETHTIYDGEGYTKVSITHQMAMAWLREKGIYITIIYGDYPANKKVFWTPQIDSLEGFDLPDSFYQEYDLYEDSVEAALKYCLENLI